MVTPIINQPRRTRRALEGTQSPVVLDLETTGLTRHDDIVSVGLLIDNQPYINFLFTRFIPVISRERLRHALEPLATREDLVIVGHNLGFDLGFLHRVGIKVAGTAHDTELLLRLQDPDRGKNKDVLSARIDRLAPPGSPSTLDYKLKHVVPQLLHIGMVGFSDHTPMEVLPYEQHVQYLTSDLLGTAALYDHLMDQLTPGQREYNDKFIAPLTPLLVGMTEVGIGLDEGFVRARVARLEGLRVQLSEEHRRVLGVPLGMNQKELCSWLFGELGLYPESFKKLTAREWASGRSRREPSLDSKHLAALERLYSGDPRAINSLALIRSYRLATSLMVGLKKLLPHCDYRDRRIHTKLRDTQATGRISSTTPPLQNVSKAQKVAGVEIISRNALVAQEGFVFCDFDVKQADVRVMAHHVAAFPCRAKLYTKQLQKIRLTSLRHQIGTYLDKLPDHYNRYYRGKHRVQVPDFDPAIPCALGEVLRTAGGDPYPEVASRITGMPVADVDSQVRKAFKQVTLGMVNSITPAGLARQLGYGDSKAATKKAKNHMEDFWRVYPQVKLYTETMWWHVALTGQTETWAGRTRSCAAHRWMVSLPRVELLCSFRQNTEWLWLDVVPLRPGRHCLTVWIKRAWDATYRSANQGCRVYEDSQGPLCTRPYCLFQADPPLLYLLPARNISWRSIRRVRTDTEEATYHGFDSTARGLVNSIYQGGTADLTKVMLKRCQPLCDRYGARLLLQIHDEILAECPAEQALEFTAKMKAVLQQQPSPGFRIPILVDAKIGPRFGALKVWEDI